jgi:ubiquinone/menaquinone biosynthesis C-methylase UbiE
MDYPLLTSIRCPQCRKELRFIDISKQEQGVEEATLACDKNHRWQVTGGIPSLVYPEPSEQDMKWIREYDQMAGTYDEAVLAYDDWLGIDMMKEREATKVYIPMEGPSRILDVSLGTGANFIALGKVFGERMGRFDLHGLDLSRGMLHVASEKFSRAGLHVSLTHASVFNLPYETSQFDIVLSSGGINTFSDIPRAMEEMLRVVKKEGFVIITDEGVSPQLRKTTRGQEIIAQNSLFGSRPPLDSIPESAREVEVRYVMNDTFYQVLFRK